MYLKLLVHKFRCEREEDERHRVRAYLSMCAPGSGVMPRLL